MGNRFETHGDFSWTELLTRELEASKKFYADLLGWQMESVPMQEGGYILIKVGDQAVAGIMVMPHQVPDDVPSHRAVYVTVHDVDARAQKALGAGG